MGWKKLGRVFAPDGSSPWMTSHAYVPTPHALDENTIRVYVAFLDEGRIGRVGFVDLDTADPTRLLRVSESPALDVGEAGTFDEHGVTPSCVVEHNGELRLYYFGWQRAAHVPYFLFGGLAVSEDGGETFTRISRTPILPPAGDERICRSAPSVLKEGSTWRAWYVAADALTDLKGRPVPTYEIRTVPSDDGKSWSRHGTTALALASDDEFGLGRPFVRPSADGYRMWYSIRSHSRGYRIGFATSVDGISWTRRDEEAEIGVSSDGWDSEMICFGAVQPTCRGTYLFYNGNDYGATGFGVAVLDNP
jgi:hypothetical protein